MGILADPLTGRRNWQVMRRDIREAIEQDDMLRSPSRGESQPLGRDGNSSYQRWVYVRSETETKESDLHDVSLPAQFVVQIGVLCRTAYRVHKLPSLCKSLGPSGRGHDHF